VWRKNRKKERERKKERKRETVTWQENKKSRHIVREKEKGWG